MPAPAAAPGRRNWLKGLGALLGGGLLARTAQASPTHVTGSDPYIGEIMLFGGNFAPVYWLECAGQSLPISEYDVLFSLLGTTYGGDGQTTFNLPDLRSRVPRHVGTGAGLAVVLGQKSGSESATLTGVPSHSHPVVGSGAPATSSSPVGAAPAVAAGTDVNGEVVAVNAYASADNSAIQNAAALLSAGGGQPVPLQPAVLGVRYCIAYNGLYPPQN